MNFKFEFPAFLAGAVWMDPDLYMIREEGGERPEAGAVRDELDNQASSSKKLRKIFQKKSF